MRMTSFPCLVQISVSAATNVTFPSAWKCFQLSPRLPLKTGCALSRSFHWSNIYDTVNVIPRLFLCPDCYSLPLVRHLSAWLGPWVDHMGTRAASKTQTCVHNEEKLQSYKLMGKPTIHQHSSVG